MKLDLPDEQILTSPAMNVGSRAAGRSRFPHRFAFEAGNWDGGVIEISTNGGATWTDIGVGSYNGVDECGHERADRREPPGVRRSATSAGRTSSTSTRNLGTTYAGQNVHDPLPHRRR